MIEVRNLVLTAGEKQLLEDVQFSIGEGEKIAFNGPSGSGKTTLLKTLAGFQPAKSGWISLLGNELKPANLKIIRSGVAFVSQNPFLGRETVERALMWPFTLRISGRTSPPHEKLEQSLTNVGLEKSILKEQSASLSGGEKQRAVIARALIMDPSILFVDEPTTGLDSESAGKLVDTLLNFKGTLITASHDDSWLKRCEKVFRFTPEKKLQLPGDSSGTGGST